MPNKTIAELRELHTKFWEAAATGKLTRQREVEYWESCADAQPGLLDEIERLQKENDDYDEILEKRVAELEAALREGLELWLENHAECAWSQAARATLNKEPQSG